jgi:hypothetical protein
LETAAASAPPADPPMGASAIGCWTENNSVNAVDNVIAHILAPCRAAGNARIRAGFRLAAGPRTMPLAAVRGRVYLLCS